MQVTVLVFLALSGACFALLADQSTTRSHLHPGSGSGTVASFSVGQQVGIVKAHSIDEASGLAASRIHSNVLYLHNDKGDRSRIFAIDATSGHKLAEFEIANAGNYDWEDIAVEKCPRGNNGSCMFIGDIGDHGGVGSKKIIYVVEEPRVIGDSTLYPMAELHYSWHVKDAETLMVGTTGDVILISKEDDGRGHIGMIPSSAFDSSAVYGIIPNNAFLNIPATGHDDPVGGDISPDGTEVLVRTHGDIYYWKVTNGDYVHALSRTKGHQVSAQHEHKGEAVAWDAHGSGYFTTSEGHNQPLYKYTRL